MLDQLIVKQEEGRTWMVYIDECMVNLVRASHGQRGRYYSVELSFTKAEWERMAAWVNDHQTELRSRVA